MPSLPASGVPTVPRYPNCDVPVDLVPVVGAKDSITRVPVVAGLLATLRQVGATVSIGLGSVSVCVTSEEPTLSRTAAGG